MSAQAQQITDPYIRAGFKDRAAYLRRLANDYNLHFFQVALLSDFLGPNEDFDGLITALEDFADYL